jgi:hypothetical protein
MVSRVNIIDNKGNIAIVEVPLYVTEVLSEIESEELGTFDTVMEFSHIYNLKVIEFNGKLIHKYTTCIDINDSIIIIDGGNSLLHIKLEDTIVTLKDTQTCVLKKINKFFVGYWKS